MPLYLYLYRKLNTPVYLQDSHHMKKLMNESINTINVEALTNILRSYHYSCWPNGNFPLTSLAFPLPMSFGKLETKYSAKENLLNLKMAQYTFPRWFNYFHYVEEVFYS